MPPPPLLLSRRCSPQRRAVFPRYQKNIKTATTTKLKFKTNKQQQKTNKPQQRNGEMIHLPSCPSLVLLSFTFLRMSAAQATIQEILSACHLIFPAADAAAAATKSLFLKSKKDELVMVTALSSTATDMKEIQKAAATKDLRMASADLVARKFPGIPQHALSPFALAALTGEAAQQVKLIIDQKLLQAPGTLAMTLWSEEDKVAVKPSELLAYLQHLQYPHLAHTFTGAAAAAPAPAAKHADPVAKKAAAAPKPKAEAAAAGETTLTLLGIQNKRETNFSAWYTEVISKAEMIEYYDVSGCYIIRPWAFFVWKQIQRFFTERIDAMGVEECYFPMFVSKNCLEREKDHIEGFAPEVAWVTKAGESDLECPVAVRPTSETVMYPYYAKWIRSHRDLPIRLNMWNNVIRWEFSHPTPFIRTREFLWQEGHCAWAKYEECEKEVLEILDHYKAIYEELLAVPVVKGKKTEKEKFAGGFYTTTVEAYIDAVGRGCQGATSHNLGQNFGKMFHINFQDPENNDKALIPWQNSWGYSTRSIGVMTMVHGDNTGLVMPPRVASIQIVIIPVGITSKTSAEARAKLLQSCSELEKELKAAGIRAKADLRDNYSPGWRFNHWEVKGVPIRVEVGPRELEKKQLALAIRYNGEKTSLTWDAQVAANFKRMLDDIHCGMLSKARAIRESRTSTITAWEKFTPALNNLNIILAPWCEAMECEDAVKKDSAEESKAAQDADAAEDARAPSMGAKTLCIPFEQPGPVTGLKCICRSCNKPAKTWVLFGRSF
eukprot:gene13483-9291_t